LAAAQLTFAVFNPANPAPAASKISSGRGADDLLILPVGMDGTVGMNIWNFSVNGKAPCRRAW
jgi:hypothetical protein